MSTLFSKIIAGEIPCYKIYEDDKTFAFLDIHPETKFHTLVIPKIECDKVYDLPDDYYLALWQTVKKLARHMETITGERSLLKVVGTDVPHAHVHIMPLDKTWHHGRTLDLSDQEFKQLQAQLKLD
ncbi:HIT domain-containing protein [Candidatus Saccharibacteria bacterium]|nr:HIT domain-containing protein [Candidatus Saccharibacteria bacterium]MBQ3445362.1 HIT domain-containing protein [Candidatus Saccharibacteria bacterium]